MKRMTELQIRKWVRAGAMHPIALVRESLARRIREGSVGLWDDLDPYAYPWPARARTLRDAVAATCQDMFQDVSVKHRWRLTDKVWQAVFGESLPPPWRPW